MIGVIGMVGVIGMIGSDWNDWSDWNDCIQNKMMLSPHPQHTQLIILKKVMQHVI